MGKKAEQILTKRKFLKTCVVIGPGLSFGLVLLFYAWLLANRYGGILGLHLFILATSTFYLFSPIASYLYTLGLLPGSIHRRAQTPIIIWFLLAAANIITMFFTPVLYSRTPITALTAYILMTPGIRVALPLLSLSSLLYHWFVTHFDTVVIRLLAHIIGVITSAFILSNLYWIHRDSLIIFLNVGALNL